MNTIDKIRAEIERRKNKAETMRERAAYLGLLSFLDTLEEPVSDNLEEAAKQNADGLWRLCDWQPNWDDLYESFIAGAEWAREQMMKDGNVILAEEDFDAEKEKSMEWGYNLCKEQMPDTLIFKKGVEEGRRLEREDSKDAEIVAQMFGAPCDYNLDLDVLSEICDCENECGSEQTPARCWQKYFDYKREREDKE